MKLNTKTPHFAVFMCVLGSLSVVGIVVCVVAAAWMVFSWSWNPNFPLLVVPTAAIWFAMVILDGYDRKVSMDERNQA